MRTLRYTLAAFLLVGVAFGETPTSPTNAAGIPQLSPVPPYPANGVIPAALEHQYIFRDLSTGNLVLSYPLDLVPNGVAPAGVMEGGRIKQVINLRNQVNPFFNVQITKVNGGLLYSYTLRNESRAKQAIARWRLESPNISAMAAPNSINTTLDSENIKQAQAPASWTAAQPGVGLNWVAHSGSSAIPAGTSVGGFNLQSDFRPGFVRAFASGSDANPLQVPGIPDAVEKQLKALEPFAIDQQTALTIGPKFSSTAPDAAIVMDFASGLEILIKHHYLSTSSPLVQELRDKLHAYLEALGGAPDVLAEQYPHFTLQLQSKPGTDLERMIVGALQMSIGNN